MYKISVKIGADVFLYDKRRKVPWRMGWLTTKEMTQPERRFRVVDQFLEDDILTIVPLRNFI